VRRLFVAVDLTPASRDHVARVSDDLKHHLRLDRRCAGTKLSWVAGRNLHLTLHFLGTVAEDGLKAIIEVLLPPLAIEPFEVVPAEVGTFPASGPPRVVWIRLRDDTDRLDVLHGQIGARLRQAGRRIESRPFRAHLTVARIREGGAPIARVLASFEPGEGPPALVDHVTLYESHLTSQGSRYEAVCLTAFDAR
jgi:2'-5' RNA ligase